MKVQRDKMNANGAALDEGALHTQPPPTIYSGSTQGACLEPLSVKMTVFTELPPRGPWDK